MATTEIPIYRYHLDIKPPPPQLDANGVPMPIASFHEQRTVEAMQYREAEGRYIFDDTFGTVLTIRVELVDAIQRGSQVNKQEVEKL